jgi:hypothetical protein
MKIFDTIDKLELASLSVGQLTKTKGSLARGDGGQATYLVVTQGEYGGTATGRDLDLANGNVAVYQDAITTYSGTGIDAGNAVTTNNISGINTLSSNYVGTVGKNTIVGTNTANIATEIVSCIAIGYNTMLNSKSPQNSVAIGNDALRNISYNPDESDVTNGNVAVGAGAMYVKTTSTNCAVVGQDAFGSFNDGNRTACDLDANDCESHDGMQNTGGDYAAALGFNAISYCYGDDNSGVGHNSGIWATSGDFNTFMGAYSGSLGAPSGVTAADRSFLLAGDNCTFVGSRNGPLEAVSGGSYMTVIGAGAEVGSSNTIALGRAGTDTTVIGKDTAYINTDTTGADLQLGRGMTFGNSVQTGTSTLDWYEEKVDGTAKTWTPTTTGITYSGTTDTTGTYTRIGNRVFYDIQIESAGGTTTGTAPQITNMPWAAAHGNTFRGHNTTSGNLVIGEIVGTVAYPSTWTAETGKYVISGSYPV